MSIILGLLAGIGAAVVLLGGIIALAPEPTQSATPIPTAPDPTDPAAGETASASGSPSVSPDPSDGEGLFGTGRPAPALVVPQLGGGTIDLAALRGKPVWIYFMATWCPSCRDEFPPMTRFAAVHADDDLVVLAIDVREDEGTVAAFAMELDVILPMGLDLDGSAAARWGAVALPVHFWVDRDGIVRFGAFGGIGADIMAEGLAAIMPGVEIEP
jgi:cytochrome c biogenesis protein CcmG, thiol:disulfide interchange protein DsbE